MNRRVVDVVSDTLFAPTARCRTNLEAERLNGRIVVTGNTVIDALMATVARIEGDVRLRERFAADLPRLTPERRLILVTGHRRENFGAGFSAICDAIGRLRSGATWKSSFRSTSIPMSTRWFMRASASAPMCIWWRRSTTGTLSI